METVGMDKCHLFINQNQKSIVMGFISRRGDFFFFFFYISDLTKCLDDQTNNDGNVGYLPPLTFSPLPTHVMQDL